MSLRSPVTAGSLYDALESLSATFVQDRRDNATDPHRGMYNTFDIGIAGHFFGSQRSFGRALVRNATYHRLTKNLVLARQTQFGVIAPVAAPAGLSGSRSRCRCPSDSSEAGPIRCARFRIIRRARAIRAHRWSRAAHQVRQPGFRWVETRFSLIMWKYVSR